MPMCVLFALTLIVCHPCCATEAAAKTSEQISVAKAEQPSETNAETNADPDSDTTPGTL